MISLQAAIKYEQDELSGCKSLLDRCLTDDPETIINYAAVAFKEGHYGSARAKYLDYNLLQNHQLILQQLI